MLTECPHCATVLKVSADLIYARDPRVRCGECLRVFSARDHLTQADTDLDVTRIYKQPDSEISLDPPSFDLTTATAESAPAMKNGATGEANEAVTLAPPHHKPAERSRRAAIPARLQGTRETAPRHRTMPSAAMPGGTSAATRNPPATGSEPDASHAQKTDDAHTTHGHRHVPVLENRFGSPDVPRAKRLPWIAALLLSGVALLAINSLTNVIGDSTRVAWCAIVDCTISPSQDYSKLEVVRRKIYAHPKNKGVLVISLAMVNRLNQTMKYPMLVVRMTDRIGTVVAEGEFKPEQYVNNYREGMSIQPAKVLDVILEVRDPGESAQSFDLRFL